MPTSAWCPLTRGIHQSPRRDRVVREVDAGRNSKAEVAYEAMAAGECVVAENAHPVARFITDECGSGYDILDITVGSPERRVTKPTSRRPSR